MASIYLAALLLALAGTPEPGPLPVDDLSRFESAPAGLSVEVARASERLQPGRQTTYTITVANPGADPVTVTVRASVPPGLAGVVPDPSGELGPGHVEWPVTVTPGTPTTVQLTGAYARSGMGWQDRNPPRVALTACVLDEADDQPLVCATDIAELHTRSAGSGWWWALAGIAVVGVGGVVWWRRQRPRAPAPAATT